MSHAVPTTDAEIIDDVLNGNVNQYASLIQKYNQRLYRICRGYIGGEAEIEDIMQETYIKAYMNLRQFERRSSFATWITRILINESLQRLKITRRRMNTPHPESESMEQADHRTPESSSVNRELRDIIQNSVDALPENYRVVFVMREIEKMNVAETAEALAISTTNVKVRLNRAKEMLRAALMKTYPLQELYEFNLVRCGRVAKNVMARILPAQVSHVIPVN